jgi:DNA processing protein
MVATNKSWQTKAALIRLSLLADIGPITVTKLINKFGSASAVLNASASELQQLPARVKQALATANSIAVNHKLTEAKNWYYAHKSHYIVTKECEAYPSQLKQLADAPPVLYIIGDFSLLASPQIAIVGSRKASAVGLQCCKIFATHLANYGLAITSGMALGIDAAAHAAALATAGKTIAVLGCGVNIAYPRRHNSLYNAIATHGAVVSEFPLNTQPIAGNFPRRNRLITGLSLGVLVIEAAAASGSLISANLALEQGKEVFAVPGSILNPLNRGCHQLIRDGALLTESPDDILLELAHELDLCLANDELHRQQPDPLQQKIISCIGKDVVSLDEINMQLDLEAGDLAAILTEMELHGMIESTAGGFSILH